MESKELLKKKNPERYELINNLPGWAWNASDAQFLDKFELLKEYALRQDP